MVEVFVEQSLVPVIGELAGEFGAAADLGRLGSLGSELQVDHVAGQQVALLGFRNVRHLQGRILGGEGEIPFRDVDAVDTGDHLGRIDGGHRRRGRRWRGRGLGKGSPGHERQGDAEGQKALPERE